MHPSILTASDAQLQPLQDLQTKTLTRLLKLKDSDEKGIHDICKISLLEHRQKEQLALIIFNIKQRGHDSYLITPLETANHPYETRGHDHNLILPKPNANSLRKTVTYRSIQLWNDLPVNIIICENKQTFKKLCRLHYNTN